MQTQDNIILARGISAHGLKGQVNIIPTHLDFSVIQDIKNVRIIPKKNNNEEIEAVIKDIILGHKILASFENYPDRTSIEQILPFELCVKRSDFPPLKHDDDYYFCDLIGLDCTDEKTNEALGTVCDIYHNGAQNVLTVTTSDDSFDVPMVEVFVKQINLKDGYIRIVKPLLVNE